MDTNELDLNVNSKSEITGYSLNGGGVDTVEYSGKIPDDFVENFKPAFYLLQNGLIVTNPNYVAPTWEPSKGGSVWDAVNAIGQQVATLSAQQLINTQDISDIKNQLKPTKEA